MARKLASIQRIATVEPIKKADFIVKVTLEKLGWHLVAKKDDFKEGDLCVFFEIDAILPKEPWAEFMEPRKYRVRTVKMRKVLSQGLALPLDILDQDQILEVFEEAVLSDEIRTDPSFVGTDLTDILAVGKYEIPAITGMANTVQQACEYPRAVLPKTDETRLQSCLEVLRELQEVPWYATVKLDGTSATFVRLQASYGPYDEGDLMVCTRNRAIREIEPDPDSTKPKKENAYFKVARRYDFFKNIPRGYAIQGELVGPGIQKNKLELDDMDVFVFNVWDAKAMRYLDYGDASTFCLSRGFRFVPLVGICTSDMLRCPNPDDPIGPPLEQKVEYTLEWFLKLAEGMYAGTKRNREGIVVRPLHESYSQALGERFSFKVLNNIFLLKDED